ncbi:MAG: ATP-binding protein [Chloroflexi bacterium]|nr:ATP-binding protein [Chloroflexota bacterium]
MRLLGPPRWRIGLTYAALTVAGVATLSIFLAVREDGPGLGRIIGTIWLWGLGMAAVTVVAGYLLTRKTARSMESMAERARRLAEGDLEHRIAPATTDETREMASSFNAMASTIRDMVRDLSGERNKLSAVLNTMVDGVVVLEPDGSVSLMNQAAQWLLDIRTTKPVGIRLVEMVRDSDLLRVVTEALESGRPRHDEVELLHRGAFVSVIVTPLSGDGSRGVLLTLHDLSSVRKLETTRREFVSNVSHELRSPLASIKALVETLQDGALEEREVAMDFMGRIQKDVDRMGNLVDDLLALSRLESGQTPINLGPLDLRVLTEEVLGDFKARAQNVDMEHSLSPELAIVTGDEGMVRQALLNLLENALKFTPKGGRISIGSVTDDESVEIRVTDNGTGIPAEHLPHVFERFYKVDRARHDGGTGLGLAIVKHIVQVHGGDVRVESEEGAGSTFAFTLPRAV